VLIGGGARSGKSRYALDLARQRGGRLTFVGTAAPPHDAEMEARIAKHRAGRGAEFTTIEEPLEIAEILRKAQAGVIVVDCLTLWLSNVMLTFGRDIDADTEAVVNAALHSPASVIMVTNEVGCGIVPESTLGRDFRDRAGVLNQRVASAAEEVYWMVFGYPIKVK
jgi:adenosylcobinamide kinase/adenosylcobinamide-phosphate guanylyltransferase